MKIKYTENPADWRKSTLLTVLGLALVSSLLRWRHVLSSPVWIGVLAAMGCIAVAAGLRPQAFRPYYRFSTWAGFWSSQAVARAALFAMFLVILVPAGVLMRLLGKDPLHLRRPSNTSSYWNTAKPSSPLDRLF